MHYVVEVDVSGKACRSLAGRLAAPELPAKFWWWGGVSWRGHLDQPLHVRAEEVTTKSLPLPDFFRTTNQRFVSRALRQVLQGFDAAVEFWPAKVELADYTLENYYFAVNSLVRLSAVDLAQSDVDLDSELGDAITVRRLVLDSARLGQHPWVVAQEINRVIIVDRLASAIGASGCTGCTLLKPAELRY